MNERERGGGRSIDIIQNNKFININGIGIPAGMNSPIICKNQVGSINFSWEEDCHPDSPNKYIKTKITFPQKKVLFNF